MLSNAPAANRSNGSSLRGSRSLQLSINMDTEGKDEGWYDKKRQEYQYMVGYHAPMRPCLHKSYYAMVGFLNPWLKEGTNEEEEDGDS